MAFAEVTINGAGVLTGTADWTFATNDIDIYVTAPSCRATDISRAGRLPGVGRNDRGHREAGAADGERDPGQLPRLGRELRPSSESGTLQMTATVSR